MTMQPLHPRETRAHHHLVIAKDAPIPQTQNPNLPHLDAPAAVTSPAVTTPAATATADATTTPTIPTTNTTLRAVPATTPATAVAT